MSRRELLKELGYLEGRNIAFELRWSEGDTTRWPALVAELIRMPVDLIVAPTTGAAVVARKATRTIPIVSASAGMLVEEGLVESLARPGGNVTGLTGLAAETASKRLELLRDAVPNLVRVAVLTSPYNPPSLGDRLLKETAAGARVLGIQIQVLRIVSSAELDDAFKAAVRERAGAVDVLPNPFFRVHAARVAELGLRYRLPTMNGDPTFDFVEAGGLMSHGPSVTELWRRAATYVDKILKGAKPADLPIEQPTTFDLAINLRTAQSLGLNIPESLRLRASKLIK
jgi:putative ABC transport system substrate-binding protein